MERPHREARNRLAIRHALAGISLANCPDAPLFLVRSNQNASAPRLPMHPSRALSELTAHCKLAETARRKPHDFRHTKAYWCKLNDWADSQMCVFFGWSSDSKMPRYYGEFVAADLRSTVRRDAAVNNLRQVLAATGADQKLKQLQDVLRSVLGPSNTLPGSRYPSANSAMPSSQPIASSRRSCLACQPSQSPQGHVA